MVKLLEEKYKRRCAEAAYWMLYYPDHKADHEKTSEIDIILSVPPPKEILEGRNSVKGVYDITGDKAVKLLLYERSYIARWLELCEYVEADLDLSMGVFLGLRRHYRHELHNNGWIVKIEFEYPLAFARIQGGDEKNIKRKALISRRTLQEWWNKINRITAMEAIERGLIK